MSITPDIKTELNLPKSVLQLIEMEITEAESKYVFTSTKWGDQAVDLDEFKQDLRKYLITNYINSETIEIVIENNVCF